MRQKARVEGSICKSYIDEEASFFFSHYFKDHVDLSFVSVPRNDDQAVEQASSSESVLSIFKQYGRHASESEEVWLDDKEYHVAHTYILLNCSEVAPFIR